MYKEVKKKQNKESRKQMKSPKKKKKDTDLNREFTKEVEMGNKQSKVCSISLVTRKI